jgi:hypothetical protein
MQKSGESNIKSPENQGESEHWKTIGLVNYTLIRWLQISECCQKNEGNPDDLP